MTALRVLTVGNMYPPHSQGGYALVWRSAVHHLREQGHAVRGLVSGHREERPLRSGRYAARRDTMRAWVRAHRSGIAPADELRAHR